MFEQSTPYTANILKGQPINILAGTTLLCVLVIINAFKNDNMLELMNPKKFQSFENFKQLLEANYSVYSLPYFLGLR